MKKRNNKHKNKTEIIVLHIKIFGFILSILAGILSIYNLYSNNIKVQYSDLGYCLFFYDLFPDYDLELQENITRLSSNLNINVIKRPVNIKRDYSQRQNDNNFYYSQINEKNFLNAFLLGNWIAHIENLAKNEQKNSRLSDLLYNIIKKYQAIDLHKAKFSKKITSEVQWLYSDLNNIARSRVRTPDDFEMIWEKCTNIMNLIDKSTIFYDKEVK